MCTVLPQILCVSSNRSGSINLSISTLFTCLLLHLPALNSTGNVLRICSEVLQPAPLNHLCPAVPHRAHSTDPTEGTGALRDCSSINEDNRLIPFTLYTTGNFPVQLQRYSRKHPGDTILQAKLHRDGVCF